MYETLNLKQLDTIHFLINESIEWICNSNQILKLSSKYIEFDRNSIQWNLNLNSEIKMNWIKHNILLPYIQQG
jgi:hypothetical protein